MSASDILNVLKQDMMSTDRRLLSLRWNLRVRAASPAGLQPLRAVIDEGIGEGIRAFVACVTLDPAVPVDELKGKPFAVTIRTEDGGLRLFPMIVQEANPTTSATPGVSAVNLVGRDVLYTLNHRKRMRVFTDETPLGVIDKVLRAALTDPALAGLFTFRFAVADKSRYKRRACFLQHPDETDLEFINRLARTNGLEHCWSLQTEPPVMAYGPRNTEVPVPELVFFDSPQVLKANPKAAVPFHRRDGAQISDAIELLAATNRTVPDGVDVYSWDHEAARLASSSARTGLDQGREANALGGAMRSTRQAIDHFGDDFDELDRLAKVQADHHAFNAHGLRGRGDVRTMAPGTYQVIENYPLFAGRSAEDCTYMTVRVTHVVENNMPVRLHEPAQAFAGDPGVPDWARQETPAGDGTTGGTAHGTVAHRYTNEFHLVARGTPLVPFYVEERDQPRRRPLVGIVLGRDIDGGEIVCDELGRVRVRLVGGEPDADRTVWVRPMVSWGGNNHGHFGALRAGTEVTIEVTGPDRLVIAGVLYNAATPPPSFDHLPGLPANAAVSGTVTRELDGMRQQQLRFNDAPGNISVQLGTDHAATQLNIGALATPMNRGRTQRRGSGFEMRTDDWGSLRAGLGLLISTEAQPDATGHVTDIADAGRRLDQANGQHQRLADAAHQAQAQQSGDQDDVVKALQTQLGEVRGEGKGNPAKGEFPEFREPHLLLASPAGLETSTRGSTHFSSTEHIALTSGGHASISANKSLLASVKESIKLFAFNAGMKLVAAASDIDISALKNSVNILARLDITQTANRITITAKEEVVINGGGSFSRWNGSGITHGTGGTCRYQAASYSYTGPANMPASQPKAPDVALKDTPPEDQIAFSVQHVPGPSPMLFANQPYTLLKDGAEVRKGLFDDYGRLTVDKAEKGARYQVRLHNGTLHDVPVAQDRMASDPAQPDFNEQQLSNRGYRADGQAGDARLAQRERGTVAGSDGDASDAA